MTRDATRRSPASRIEAGSICLCCMVLAIHVMTRLGMKGVDPMTYAVIGFCVPLNVAALSSSRRVISRIAPDLRAHFAADMAADALIAFVLLTIPALLACVLLGGVTLP